MNITLVRHGACRENIEKRFIGVTDSPLDLEGAKQALALAQKLGEVDHIYVSPLARCRQTMVLVWPRTDFTVVDDLRETDFGPFEGKTHEELKDDDLYNKWIWEPDDPSIVPLVEDVVSCGLRATKALTFIVKDSRGKGFENIAIVSHGGTIMGMMARHGLPKHSYYSWRMDNCGGFIITVEGENDELSLRLVDKF